MNGSAKKLCPSRNRSPCWHSLRVSKASTEHTDISSWARLMFADFMLNSGRREKVSFLGVASDPTRPPYPQLRDFMDSEWIRVSPHDSSTCLAPKPVPRDRRGPPRKGPPRPHRRCSLSRRRRGFNKAANNDKATELFRRRSQPV